MHGPNSGRAVTDDVADDLHVQIQLLSETIDEHGRLVAHLRRETASVCASLVQTRDELEAARRVLRRAGLVEAAARFIVETFTTEEAQGYTTQDRAFVLTVLSAALDESTQNGGPVGSRPPEREKGNE